MYCCNSIPSPLVRFIHATHLVVIVGVKGEDGKTNAEKLQMIRATEQVIMCCSVAFTDSERLIGDAAKNYIAMIMKNRVFDAKRLIGRGFSDPAIQEDMKH
ncbi:heat shock protein, putative [Entamoeba invadens IP1]|uniref:Heat shock protein, putative n=1 Tax=Entamoeba invadens IP1 TaxID=370355 RepID=L7FKI8_ENTIV|nr:heat shock protein, putative [Entamoeba invadens IP1]ELP86383.1 heat shock protein, putative [Entamoeba invadens IP1]|eukprot:XP_004185729.1 heat shock protein, putative [Entamoeba invadens IP1]